MRPVLFRLRGHAVSSYPAMLYAGLVAGVFASDLAARHSGVDPFRSYVAILILLVPALVGARLLYVACRWDRYRGHVGRVWDRREGGFIMYGGLPAALLASVPLLRAMKLEFGAFWDVATFTILVGMIFTRAGCLLNGCCAGHVSNAWCAIRLPNSMGDWERRIPTQMLEQLWAATSLVTAIVVWDRLPFRGALFLLTAISYAGWRFLMEFAREREPKYRFNVNHWISVIIFIASVTVLSCYWAG